jgi:hypothetical protein
VRVSASQLGEEATIKCAWGWLLMCGSQAAARACMRTCTRSRESIGWECINYLVLTHNPRPKGY